MRGFYLPLSVHFSSSNAMQNLRRFLLKTGILWMTSISLIPLGSAIAIAQIAVPARQLTNRAATHAPLALTPPPVMLGLYTRGFAGDQGVIDRELREIDAWAGRQTSITGVFLDIEGDNPAYNIPTLLGRLRQNGYTAFINLKSRRTATAIAQGDVDAALRNIAQAYADWAKGGPDRMVFIAPLQEMNIPGESYAQDPLNFKLAYQRIQQIFREQGVSQRQVQWVFAPNGWSQPNHAFEHYYPGGDRVDVVAFSGYNWGYCQMASWKEWQGAKAVFAPYLKRMQAMAPDKPIFIAQTGTVSETKDGPSPAAKAQWLRESYAYLATIPKVRAILYFNMQKECDWALWDAMRHYTEGYKDAINQPAFGYVAPADLARMHLE